MSEREQAHADWAARHDGVDPAASAWVSGWARLTHACARPLTRRGVHPDAVTAVGVAVTGVVVVLAGLGSGLGSARGWGVALLLGVPVLVAGAVLDGVDGAVASQRGGGSRWGRVLDPLADRCSDLLLLLVLVLLGAPGWLGTVAGVLTLLLESARASAQVAGLHGPGRVTVWERPSRVVVTAFALAGCGVLVLAGEPGLARGAGTVAAVVAVGLALVGHAQLLPALRRALR